MKRMIWKLIAGLVLVTGTTAQAGEEFDINFDLGVGYRQDTLNWNVADPSGTPNVLNERKWKSVRSIYFGGQMSVSMCHYVLNASGGYGTIFYGNSSSRTWDSDDRTDLANHTRSLADRGEVYDASASIGYQCPLNISCISVTATPRLGYSRNVLHLRQKNGEQVFPVVVPDNITKLRNEYKAQFYGPWVGLDLSTRIMCMFNARAGFEWHWATYRGKGKDREGEPVDLFVKYTHKDSFNGYGPLFYLGGDFRYLPCLNVGVFAYYQHMCVSRAKQRAEVLLPLPESSSSSRVNSLNWRHFNIIGTLGMDF